MKINFPLKNAKCYCAFFAFLLFSGISAFSQEQKVIRDLALWTEIKLEKKIIRDLYFSVSQHFRFNKDISGFDDYISEVGLQYSINSNFSIGANGRYTRNKQYDETIENDYRYDFNFGYDAKIIKKVKFFYRFKYQKEFYGSSVFNEYLHYYETTFRNRVKVGWKMNENHRLYSSAEIFRLTKQSRDPYFNKYRIFFGDDITSSFGDFDMAFGFEHELNSKNPYTNYIFKIMYKFGL